MSITAPSIPVREFTVVAAGEKWSGIATVMALTAHGAAERFERAQPGRRVIAVFDGRVEAAVCNGVNGIRL